MTENFEITRKGFRNVGWGLVVSTLSVLGGLTVSTIIATRQVTTYVIKTEAKIKAADDKAQQALTELHEHENIAQSKNK